MRASVIICLSALLFFVAAGPAAAEPPVAPSDPAIYSLDQVKAAFLLNFGRFVEWPQVALGKSAPIFHLCIIGASVPEEFERVLRRQIVKDRKLELRVLDPAAKIQDCQILYVRTADARQASDILAKSSAVPTLTVGDLPNFTQIGGIIQFKVEAKHLRFRLNLAEAERAGLKISSKLLNIAEVVP